MGHDTAALLNRIQELIQQPPTGRPHDAPATGLHRRLRDWFWRRPPPAADREELIDLTVFLQEALNAYCRSGPGSPESFARQCTEVTVANEVRRAVAAARADVNGSTDLRADVPHGLRARVHGPTLAVIVYNLLKNSWQHTGKGGPTDLRVRVNDRDLLVTVEGSGPFPQHVVDEVTRDEFTDFPAVHSRSRDGHGLGIRLCVRLAGWHRTTDGRRGQLELPSLSSRQIHLRLPILDEEF